MHNLHRNLILIICSKLNIVGLFTDLIPLNNFGRIENLLAVTVMHIDTAVLIITISTQILMQVLHWEACGLPTCWVLI